jgi:ribosomal protein S18 acetylase RimI-like enzyme
MESPLDYSNICKLKNGMRLLIRPMNNGDHEEFAQFTQGTPEEILQFCKLNVKDKNVIKSLLDPAKAQRGIPLIALDLVNKKPVGSIYLEKGQGPELKIGEIQQILVAQHLQGVGLGSMLLDSLIYFASRENLHWLKAEVVTELKSVTKAFESRGFKIKAFLEDYFTDLQGRMYDVVLMLRPLIEEKVDF